jgi:hypothetical protein
MGRLRLSTSGLFEELCRRKTENVGKVVTFSRTLLQHQLPHVHWYDTLPSIVRIDAPTFVDLVFEGSRAPKAKDWIIESQEILKLLKENLQTTQNRQKISADKHRIEHNFEVGDLFFLRLQPYK